MTYGLKKHTLIKTCISLAIFLLSVPHASSDVLRTVLIDSGHGGYDSGIITNNLKEKALAVVIARELESLLKAEGKRVFLTRKVDRYFTIEERISYAIRSQIDVFVSIHATLSEGFSIYVSGFPKTEPSPMQYYSLMSRQRPYLEKSKALAKTVAEALKREFNIPVSIREMPMPILNSMGAPAIMVEVPMKGVNYEPGLIAGAIAQGVFRYENQ
ncbi:MAG: N-acetylmuramoyl-L-alanine amidase [Nitrospirae bacterium]|nr:N-acetylmuramoyl-L-alanine amidase [Nitrospirota bacterium]